MRAGDAVAPRSIHEAILEGRRAALALEYAPTLPPGDVVVGGRHEPVPLPVHAAAASGRWSCATASSSPRTSRTTRRTACPPSNTPPTTRRGPRGGAGLIITEEHSTHPTDWPYEKLIHGFHPEVVPGYRRITEAVHRHGTPIFAQINHNGGQASGMYTRLPVWAPSPVADPLFREVPKEIDRREIAEIVAGYALVAEHCREGGFDGIELQCSHSSIVRGVPVARDERPHRQLRRLAGQPGAAAAARSSPPFETPSAAIMALGVRLCGDELIEGGTTIDDAVEVARMVEEQGLTSTT